MTTVIIDTRKNIVYTDSQATTDDCSTTPVSKIFRSNPSGIVLVGSGSLQTLHEIHDALNHKADLVCTPKCPISKMRIPRNTTGILILRSTVEKKIKYLSVESSVKTNWFGLKSRVTAMRTITEASSIWYDGFILIGSGRHAARAVLAATANPSVAIRVAAKLDLYTDANVQSLDYSHLLLPTPPTPPTHTNCGRT